MADMFAIWAQGDGLTPAFPEDEKTTREYVKHCVDHGVTRLIPGGNPPLLVQIAHENGLEVDTYRGVNTYGLYQGSYEMSMEYVLPYLGSPEARETLDKHRPMHAVREYNLNIQDPFAIDNRHFWNKTQDGSIDPNYNERVSLSFGFEEVRQHESSLFINAHKESQSDGTQLEFVLMNMDEFGINNYGYEDPIVETFKDKYSKDPFQISNDDPDWLQHRADYTTQFVRDIRRQLSIESPGARLTSTLIARDFSEYIKVFQDWPTWIDENLVDEFYIWFRTTNDLEEVKRQTKYAADIINGRTPFIVELSCYHPGSFQEPEILVEAARVARDNGADAVGLYRSHAVEQLNLWSAVDKMRKI